MSSNSAWVHSHESASCPFVGEMDETTGPGIRKELPSSTMEATADGELAVELDVLFEGHSDAGSLFGGDDIDPSLFMEESSSGVADAPSRPPLEETPSIFPSLIHFNPLATFPPPRRTLPEPLSDNRGQATEDVSTQNLFDILPPAELEPELEGLLDTELRDEQSIDFPPAGSKLLANGDQAGHADVSTRLTTPPLVHCGRRSRGEVPRRIDEDGQNVLLLLPHITLNSATKPEQVYQSLGLHKAEGRFLVKDVKTYLRNPGLDKDLSRREDGGRAEKTKIFLLRSALGLLKEEGWGEKWFDSSSSGQGRRRYAWPTDSTMIIYHFVSLLYRVMRNEQQRKYATEKRPKSNRCGTSRASSSDLSNYSYLSPLAMTSTRASPAAFGTPLPSPSTERPESPFPRLHPPQDVNSTVSRHPDDVIAISHSDEEHEGCTSVEDDMPSPSLIYCVNIMRGSGRAIPQIALGCSTRSLRDGLSTIVAQCSQLGVAVAVAVLTPTGLRLVRTDGEWIRAIREIAQEELMDGVVKVRIDVLD